MGRGSGVDAVMLRIIQEAMEGKEHLIYTSLHAHPSHISNHMQSIRPSYSYYGHDSIVCT